MTKLTIVQIRDIFRRDNLDEKFCVRLSDLLDKYKDIFAINTEILRIRFLAQIVHEVKVNRDGTIRMREGLNYNVKGIMGVSKFFRHNRYLTNKYARTSTHPADQIMIANYFYADRLGNGNVESGDGWRFRGAGVLQTTGRYNTKADINHAHSLVIDKIADESYNLLDGYTTFILLGMAHWHRTSMYLLSSTNAVTNRVNYGLPKKKKRERLATAIRIQKYLT